jgi:signal transduction histidine kinase
MSACGRLDPLRTVRMLRRRSIRLRIIVLVLVPVLALLGLYGVVLNLTLGNVLTLKQEASVRQLVALPVANVQNALAKERTLALAYLAKPDHPALVALLGQERMTDKAIRQFGTAVQTALKAGPVPKERQAFLTWRRQLGSMNGIRTSVISHSFTRTEATAAYSGKLDGGDNVLNQAIIPVLTGPLGVQATDLLALAKVSQNVGEESDLLRADLLARNFQLGDINLIDQLAVLHREMWAQTIPDLEPSLRGYFVTLSNEPAALHLANLEGKFVSNPAAARNVPLREWSNAAEVYQREFLAALLKSAHTLANQATSQADSLALNLILIATLSLIAIVIAAVIAFVVSRGLIRQLTDLRQSAVDLSAEQLPGALRRLREGQDVDVGTLVPPLEPGDDEIGQVRQAFNTAARTAITAAIDELKIRQGVNDVFRNLARRNQSLLSRQLQLLDAMERRVHEPEELADLFRIDHLTTRMRRHAEGLLIVAGGSSGRTWREPVPIVDVMRAAVAEVEDYTRIRVTSRTSAAIAGHAVADIIHLLAELVENATTFSPTNTPVRVDGDKVAKGVVVEIEDRGLGMNPDQLDSLNATLENPPQFDLSGSDQLGLFIAGQLAKRHDIKVSLRNSPYGGVVAVVLIPRAMTVDYDESAEPPSITSIRELSGRPVAKLIPGQPELSGSGTGPAALTAGTVGSDAHPNGVQESDGYIDGWPVPALAADDLPVRGAGRDGLPNQRQQYDDDLPVREPESNGPPVGRTWLQGSVAGVTEPDDLPVRGAVPASEPFATGAAATDDQQAADQQAAAAEARPEHVAPPESRAPLPVRGSDGWQFPVPADGLTPAETNDWMTPGRDSASRPAASREWPVPNGESGSWPVRTGESGGWPAFTGDSASERWQTPGGAVPGGWPVPADEASTPMAPGAEPATSAAPAASGAGDEPPAAPPRQVSVPGLIWNESGIGLQKEDSSITVPADLADLDGLPMRVRQASIAPELRDDAAAPASEPFAAVPAPDPVPSPEAARSLMSALQRGWERGRSDSEDDHDMPTNPGPGGDGVSPDGDTGGWL